MFAKTVLSKPEHNGKRHLLRVLLYKKKSQLINKS